MNSESEQDCLRTFGRHCRAFYDSSLILYPSSSSLSSMQEEKKADDNNLAGANTMKRKGADGKVLLETLDRINAIRSIAISMDQQLKKQQLPSQQQNKIVGSLENSIANLRKEHVLILERHHDVLMECGLHDMNKFIDQPSSIDEGDSASKPENGTGSTVSTRLLLQKYIDIRDAMRRRSHKISMLHRQNSLFEILSELSTAEATDSASLTKRLTQVENVQNTISIIQKFVHKYQSNIGSHPFLAGLHRIIHLQLNPKPDSKRSNTDPTYIVRWKFRGSVLTEACRSFHGTNNANEDDELAYAREAIQVLFSFLIWAKEIDVEGGGLIMPIEDDAHDLGLESILNNNSSSKQQEEEESSEPILSFEIDKCLSNTNLRRILAVLPDPKKLHARATGSVEVLGELGRYPKDVDTDGSNLVSRKNVDGHDDEYWPWFARLEFCTLL